MLLFSHIQLSVTPWTAAHQASLFFTISRSLLKLMSIELVMPSNYPILCHPLLPPPSIFPSIRIFSNESTLQIRWPKLFSVSPSNEYSGLISLRIVLFDLLAVQRNQESSPTPQFKSINSLALSLVYSPALTSIHDYWKHHTFTIHLFLLHFKSLAAACGCAVLCPVASVMSGCLQPHGL